jgi:hypothetical protein
LVSSYYTTYSDNGPGWAAYGGATPTVWQYTDALPYNGASCDFNAFKGTVEQFRQLVYGTGVPTPVPAPPPAPWSFSQAPPLALHILQMCAREDPDKPQGQTTNYNEVIWVQRALVAEGLLSDADKRWGRGAFGSLTVAAYEAWQRHLGYSGADADGIPGQTSLSKLAARHGMRVVA